MEALAITHPGLENITALEIKELLGKNAQIIRAEESAVIFDVKDYKGLCLLCYKAQSVIKILLLFDSFSFKNQKEIFSRAKTIAGKKEFTQLVTKRTKFRVKCARVGEHDFASSEIEAGVGEHIDAEVDLDDPETTVYAYIFSNECHIGLDFAGFDLSKRQYRIFTYKDSLKATIAYGLVRMARYKKNELLLDPMCRTGTIPIEAALFATNFPVNHYNKDNFAFLNFSFMEDYDFDKFFEKIDKKSNLKEKTRIYGYDALLGYVKASQKNAKIAGVNKNISVTRADIGWMDTKKKENEVDKIVTVLPDVTERNRKEAEKIYKEFFHQVDFILKKDGIVVISANCREFIEKYSGEYGFKVKDQPRIMQGKKELKIFIITK